MSEHPGVLCPHFIPGREQSTPCPQLQLPHRGHGALQIRVLQTNATRIKCCTCHPNAGTWPERAGPGAVGGCPPRLPPACWRARDRVAGGPSPQSVGLTAFLILPHFQEGKEGLHYVCVTETNSNPTAHSLSFNQRIFHFYCHLRRRLLWVVHDHAFPAASACPHSPARDGASVLREWHAPRTPLFP